MLFMRAKVSDLVEFLTRKNSRGGTFRVFFQGDGVSSYETFAAVANDAMFDARLGKPRRFHFPLQYEWMKESMETTIAHPGFFACLREPLNPNPYILNPKSQAIMSYCFVLLYATLHTRSPFLALLGCC